MINERKGKDAYNATDDNDENKFYKRKTPVHAYGYAPGLAVTIELTMYS